ncbi:MAG: amidohydrolase, partial [Pseudomonadaceae bacterium]|nr:amidohydrolase [Pseudomonadaceae bacterium]
MKRFIPSLLGAALACASLESMAAADLILTNGQVFTGIQGQALAKAVAVENGKILKVGSDAEIFALADADTQRIDLAGKVLMPGMIDSHTHPIMAAFDSMGANLLDEVKPLPELEQWIIAQDQAGHARRADVV